MSDRTGYVFVPMHADGGVKPHVVPRALLPATLADLRRRGGRPDLARVRPVRAFHLDAGGAMFVGTPVECFRVGRLEVTIFCHHVAGYARRLDGYRERRAGGRPFYKAHGAWSCLVLAPDKFEVLRRLVRERVGRAEATWQAFSAALRARGFGDRGLVERLLRGAGAGVQRV